MSGALNYPYAREAEPYMNPVQGRDDVYDDFPQQERRHYSNHPSKRDVSSALCLRRVNAVRCRSVARRWGGFGHMAGCRGTRTDPCVVALNDGTSR
jgi:hypothetical protein